MAQTESNQKVTPTPRTAGDLVANSPTVDRLRRQSQHSSIAKAVTMSNLAALAAPIANKDSSSESDQGNVLHSSLAPPPPRSLSRAFQDVAHAQPVPHEVTGANSHSSSVGSGPSTAPGSPRIPPIRQGSGSTTPRIRPPATTLNIPGMTRSKVSPDGRIASRDVASKLVIIMVGLPARGKSYITKKIQRYLSWQQHNSRIFNVGNRRRVAAGVTTGAVDTTEQSPRSPLSIRSRAIPGVMDRPTQAAHILLNGMDPTVFEEPPPIDLTRIISREMPGTEPIDQSAVFFDPSNEKASKIREQVALSTLDELLDYLLNQGGSVGILDATNSTVERRKLLFKRIKDREPKLGILFIESICEDPAILEANMRLKLSGPDYKDKDPVSSLEDFKRRVEAYKSAYVPLGPYEEENHMQYIQMIDVGRKVIHHMLQGFLSGGIASYLTTFNLAPRQIWITRHGESIDNKLGKLGGDSELTTEGRNYGTVLYNFITRKRQEWLVEQKKKQSTSKFPPLPGDITPPYPENYGELDQKNFCVWTSMLKRSIQTAEDFEADDDYDVKNWEMLNELDAGDFEGLTYDEIERRFPHEYEKRSRDKLHYVYPGVGGEGYLQVISRLRDMVREIERITDHVLIIGHRSVARVLMAYFMDLTRDDIADLDVPLGMLYVIEPKPYGVDFHAYKYNENTYWFDELKGYKPQKETRKGN